VLSLVLRAIGTVPTIAMLIDLLHRELPPCSNRDDALSSATWAVALQYASVERPALAQREGWIHVSCEPRELLAKAR
jgi:hypothetical protein